MLELNKHFPYSLYWKSSGGDRQEVIIKYDEQYDRWRTQGRGTYLNQMDKERDLWQKWCLSGGPKRYVGTGRAKGQGKESSLGWENSTIKDWEMTEHSENGSEESKTGCQGTTCIKSQWWLVHKKRQWERRKWVDSGDI